VAVSVSWRADKRIASGRRHHPDPEPLTTINNEAHNIMAPHRTSWARGRSKKIGGSGPITIVSKADADGNRARATVILVAAGQRLWASSH